ASRLREDHAIISMGAGAEPHRCTSWLADARSWRTRPGDVSGLSDSRLPVNCPGDWRRGVARALQRSEPPARLATGRRGAVQRSPTPAGHDHLPGAGRFAADQRFGCDWPDAGISRARRPTDASYCRGVAPRADLRTAAAPARRRPPARTIAARAASLGR